MLRRWLTLGLRATIFIVAYLISTVLLHGRYLFSQDVLWLATGTAVAGLWLLGVRYWPAVTIAVILHRIVLHYPFPYFLFAAAGNTLEAVVAVLLLRRLGFRQDFGRLRDGLALLAAAAIAPVVSAFVGRTGLLFRPQTLSIFGGMAGWWRMNALGILVVVPVVLSWVSGPHRRPQFRTVLEVLGFTSAALGLVWFLLSIDNGDGQLGMALSYLALPLALSAAVRFGVRGAATAGAAVAVLLTIGATQGYGPFVASRTLGVPTSVREITLQAVIAIVMATPLLLGAVIAERQTAVAGFARERERGDELVDTINRNVSEGLFRHSPEHGLVFANTAFAHILGYEAPEEMLGLPIKRLVAPAARAADMMDAISRRERILHEEVECVRRDGTTIPTLVTCTGVCDREGRLLFCDGAVSDITARKRLEEQLRQAQKMEALGKLAGGVAHDFNNLLTAIGGYAELLRARLPEDSPARRDAEVIANSVTRAEGLTRQLLAYSRRQVLAPQVMDLRTVVDQLGSMLRRVIGEHIHLVACHAAGPAFVRVDRGQIEQVILNLVLNARDAMPHGGVITLTTALAETAAAHGPADTSPSPCVLLCVEDTGVGMDAEVQRRAFDPFFTTKEPGKGTGLGLSTVYGIARQSGGNVWLESAPQEGTRVWVSLPREAGPALEPAQETVQTGPIAHRGTILVAEDEAPVRELIAQALRSAGHTVLVAADGEEALAVADAAHGPIDLVVTDVVMPRLGGRELAAELLAAAPSLRVLFISGYASDALAPSDLLDPRAAYLPKPFTPAALLERVRTMLGTGALATSTRRGSRS